MIILFVSLLITLIFSYFTIPLLKKLKANQELNRYLIDMHKNKSNTPTMGGIIFLTSFLVVNLLLLGNDSTLSFVSLASTIAFGILGFLDDFIKIRFKQNEGLKAYQKIFGYHL